MRMKNSQERGKDPSRSIATGSAQGTQQPVESSGNVVGRFAFNYVKRKIISAIFMLLMVPGLLCGVGIFEANRFVSYDNVWWFQILCGVGIVISITLLALGVLWFNKKTGEQVI